MRRHERGVYYTLRDRAVVPCDVKEWERMFASDERIVARSTLGEGSVSTVFLGLDHGFGCGPQVFFETAIFAEGFAIYGRCATWDEAETMHSNACAQVLATLLRTEITMERLTARTV